MCNSTAIFTVQAKLFHCILLAQISRLVLVQNYQLLSDLFEQYVHFDQREYSSSPLTEIKGEDLLSEKELQYHNAALKVYQLMEAGRGGRRLEGEFNSVYVRSELEGRKHGSTVRREKVYSPERCGESKVYSPVRCGEKPLPGQQGSYSIEASVPGLKGTVA
jgi:hypothetical protein